VCFSLESGRKNVAEGPQKGESKASSVGRSGACIHQKRGKMYEQKGNCLRFSKRNSGVDTTMNKATDRLHGACVAGTAGYLKQHIQGRKPQKNLCEIWDRGARVLARAHDQSSRDFKKSGVTRVRDFFPSKTAANCV